MLGGIENEAREEKEEVEEPSTTNVPGFEEIMKKIKEVENTMVEGNVKLTEEEKREGLRQVEEIRRIGFSMPEDELNKTEGNVSTDKERGRIRELREEIVEQNRKYKKMRSAGRGLA